MELWTPAQLGDVFAWWKADSLSLSNGNPVSSWGDSTGNGNTVSATTTARPTYLENQVNGKSAISIVPNQYLGGEFSVTKLTKTTVLFVSKLTRSFNITDNTIDSIISIGNSILENGMAVHLTNSYSSKTNTRFSVAGTAGSVSNRYVDGSVPGTPDPWPKTDYHFGAISSIQLSSQPLRIGVAQTSALFYSKVNVAEIIVCDAILSETDRQLVEGYFAWKYGLEGNLPIGHPYKTAAPTIGSALPLIVSAHYARRLFPFGV